MRRRGEGETRGRGEGEKGRKGDRESPVFGLCVLFLVFLISSCSANSTILNSGKETPVPVTGERPGSSFEKDLESMRTANFEYIFALRRKDGGKLDAEDKAFAKQNMPPQTNRVAVSDDGKAVIAGSHFPFPPEALKLLQARFNFEDHSDPGGAPAERNINANGNR